MLNLKGTGPADSENANDGVIVGSIVGSIGGVLLVLMIAVVVILLILYGMLFYN